MAHETPGEGITGARRVVNVLQRKRWYIEDTRVVYEHGAVLALLDDDHFGTSLPDPARRPIDVPVTRQLACLGVVDHQHVDAFQQLHERVGLSFDPIVHRVTCHEVRFIDLIQHAELEPRVYVAEKY